MSYQDLMQKIEDEGLADTIFHFLVGFSVGAFTMIIIQVAVWLIKQKG